MTNHIKKSSDKNQNSFDVVIPQPSLLVGLGIRKYHSGLDNWCESWQSRGHKTLDSDRPPSRALNYQV